MPITGPIDPDKLKTLIQGGARWRDDHLVVNGQDRWLTNSGGIWDVTPNNTGIKLSQNSFNLIDSANVDRGYLVAGGITFELRAESAAGALWASSTTI
jgi:hypothetical protein